MNEEDGQTSRIRKNVVLDFCLQPILPSDFLNKTMQVSHTNHLKFKSHRHQHKFHTFDNSNHYSHSSEKTLPENQKITTKSNHQTVHIACSLVQRSQQPKSLRRNRKKNKRMKQKKKLKNISFIGLATVTSKAAKIKLENKIKKKY